MEDQPKPTVSKDFNAPDADIICRSSDNVLFRLHSRSLGNASEGFPPAEFSSCKEEVVLSEHSSTLNLMFQFMYPQPQPELEKLNFDILMQLSEAVEKYQVYPAMQLCRILMSKATPKHALDVLEYSVKHNYPALSNKAAPFVTLQDISGSSKIVSAELLRAWVRYYSDWDKRKCTALRNCHCPPHQCSDWPDHQRDIYKTLGFAVGVGNFISIRSSFELSSAAKCCKAVASSWQAKFLERMGSAPFFTDFL